MYYMKQKQIISDVVKAMRRGQREAEMEILGPGFHAKTKPHKSKKIYSRKNNKKVKF